MSSKEKFIGERVPEVGDWVRVWGQVVTVRPHPEDVTVQFESHNEHYSGLVRRDHVEFTGSHPASAQACPALIEIDSPKTGLDSPIYARCRGVHGHKRHTARVDGRDIEWREKDTSHYVEDC